MTHPDRSNRRLKLTLVPRDESDDPSILDIVRQAVEDGLRNSVLGTVVSPKDVSDAPPAPHQPLGEHLETAAREAVERSLAKVIEEFQAAGKEPAFDPAKWAVQLSKVWAVVQKAKAAGVDLHISPDDAT
jgi:hypothetical protein